MCSSSTVHLVLFPMSFELSIILTQCQVSEYYKNITVPHTKESTRVQMIDINLDTFKTRCYKNSKSSGKLVWLSQNNFYWKIWVRYFLRTALTKIAVQWHEDKAVKEAVCDQL